jgi:hypothetical protein
LNLALWEEGAKGPEGKSSWQELKANVETFEMLRPGIPKKAVKSFSVVNAVEKLLITSQPIMTMGM